MKVYANLFVNNNGKVRMTTRDTAAYPNELAVQLAIDVPDIFFRRPMPKVELKVPEEYLIDPGAEVVANWVAPDIAGALKLDVKTVEDGLLTWMKERQATDDKEVADSQANTEPEGES